MNRLVARIFEGALFVGTLAVLSAVMTAPAYAQLHRSPAASNGSAVASDVFKVAYFNNANLGGGEVETINPTSTPQLCEMMYVFDAQEEEEECCGCIVTNDGLRIQSIANLISNTSTGVVPNAGVIKIISSLPNASPT